MGKFSTPPGGERKTKRAPMGDYRQDMRYGNVSCEILISTPLVAFALWETDFDLLWLLGMKGIEQIDIIFGFGDNLRNIFIS